jgi:DedD protein
MDPQLKQRVVGAAVLVAVGVLFIPIFLDQAKDEHPNPISIAREIEPPSGFNSRVVPIDDAEMERVERGIDAASEEFVESAVAAQEPSDHSGGTQQSPTEPTIAPRTGVTAWIVQLGSFASEKNAKGLIGRLKKKKYTAFIEPYQDGEKSAFRVRVGPELTKQAAERIRAALVVDLEIDGIVMRYP